MSCPCSRRSSPYDPCRPETPPRIFPGAVNVAKTFRNVKSDFLTIQRHEAVKAVEAVVRGLRISKPSHPVVGLRHLVANAFFSMPKVSASMVARCRHMDRPSAHLGTACQILLSGSVERSDGISPLGVTDLRYTMSDIVQMRSLRAQSPHATLPRARHVVHARRPLLRISGP